MLLIKLSIWHTEVLPHIKWHCTITSTVKIKHLLQAVQYVCSLVFWSKTAPLFLASGKKSRCYMLLQITTKRPSRHIHMWIFDSSMNIMWKGVKYKRGYPLLSGGHGRSTPSFLISRTFSELSRVFFFPPLLLLISDPANKIQIVIHPIFLTTHSTVSPSHTPMPRFKPRKRSSVWIIVSVRILIDLLA